MSHNEEFEFDLGLVRDVEFNLINTVQAWHDNLNAVLSMKIRKG